MILTVVFFVAISFRSFRTEGMTALNQICGLAASSYMSFLQDISHLMIETLSFFIRR